MKEDFKSMKVADLKVYAQNNNIDIEGLRLKSEIIAKLEEEVKMEENNNKEVDVKVEETTEKKTYHLEDGTECARSAYIRQEFNKDRSRQDIAKELGVEYYIVYAATANMYNTQHPENGGGTGAGRGSVLVAKVNADLQFLNSAGEVVETAEEAAAIPRADLMKELAEAGVERKTMVDYFGVSYATVYAATKEVTGTTPRASKKLTHPVTGEEVSRADYIRELYDNGSGMKRRDIAKHLTDLTGDLVDYAVVWAATKKKDEDPKTEETETATDTTTVEE